MKLNTKMVPIEKAGDVYPAVEELIERLTSHPQSRLAAILDHHMHKVAWTSGDELFEELYKVLTNALTSKATLFDPEVRRQVNQLISVIRSHLAWDK